MCFWWKFQAVLAFSPFTSAKEVVFWFVCLLATLLKKLWTDFDEIFKLCNDTKNSRLILDGDPDHHAGYSVWNPAITQISGFDEMFRIALQWYQKQFK